MQKYRSRGKTREGQDKEAGRKEGRKKGRMQDRTRTTAGRVLNRRLTGRQKRRFCLYDSTS